MAEFKKIRRITKRSKVAAQVPTIPPSGVDHDSGLWSDTDIYEGELFLNLADEKLYTRYDNTIVLLLSGFGDTEWFENTIDIKNSDIHSNKNNIGCFGNLIIYEFNSSSTATDDGENVLQPNSVVGAGRWIKNIKIADDGELINGGEINCDRTITNDVVVYVVYDTSSLSQSAVTYLKENIVTPWFNNYKSENPGWNGTLKEYEKSDEKWLDWAGIAYNESGNPDYTGNVILIAFIDESESSYHITNTPVSNSNQPTSTFESNYEEFIDTHFPSYNSFSGFIYAVPSKSLDDPTFTTKQTVRNFVAQVAMAIKGSDYIESEIIIPPIISENGVTEEDAFKALLTDNIYKNLTKGKLENFNWGFEYDFDVGAEEITLEDFTVTIDNFINSSSSAKLNITLEQKNGDIIQLKTVDCCLGDLMTSEDVSNIINALNKGANIIVPSIASRNDIETAGLPTDGSYKCFVVETGELYYWDGTSWVFEADISEIEGSSGIWQDDGTHITQVNPKVTKLSKMLQAGQSANISSSNTLTLPAEGNYVNISDNINEIQLISKLDSDGNEIQAGTEYTIDCLAGTVFRNEYPDSGNGKSIRTDTGSTITTKGRLKFKISYDAIDDWWEIQGSGASNELLSDDISAILKEAKAYNLLVANKTITGKEIDHYLNCTVDNLYGSASVDFTPNLDGILISIGTICGIEVKNSSGDAITFLSCDTGIAESLVLIDSVDNSVMFIDADESEKEIVSQNELFEAQNNGVTLREDDDTGDIIQIDYSDSKIKTEIG